MKNKKIIIVGAGPAGLMAAVTAARAGNKVTVYEQLSRPGAKLLASGGGKCNITNNLPLQCFPDKFGRQGRFMLPALKKLSPAELCEYFSSHGVETVSDDGFHIFPASKRATDVLEVFLRECEKLNVRIIVSTTVRQLAIDNTEKKVLGVLVGNELFEAEKVIVATGGMGYPALGGRGIGYALAEQAGHAIIEPVPAMTGLKTVEAWPGQCAGISFDNASACIDLPKLRKQTSRGELLFTHNGVSGPAVIDFAGEISRLKAKHHDIPMLINFFADKDKNFWSGEFAKWRRDSGKKHIKNLLSAYMPNAVAEVFCSEYCDIASVKAAEITADARENLINLLTGVPLHISGTEGWNKAMVTRGGVSLKMVSPHSLESKLVKGLFFAGEVLDLDGPCGGYNLQWAFSSGFLSGCDV